MCELIGLNHFCGYLLKKRIHTDCLETLMDFINNLFGRACKQMGFQDASLKFLYMEKFAAS